ncbi:hypothetical protein [Dysgonomonas sp. HDW5B]|uniref:hypothetical protein n=1 Tax=Dysgonomonas sp. HDW5B TaxID=2714927 RepID=UPI001C86AE5D|nr:hypothetical protein [Dysgonomonas sp. HDW5B]
MSQSKTLKIMVVTTIEQLNALIKKVKKAQREYSGASRQNLPCGSYCSLCYENPFSLKLLLQNRAWGYLGILIFMMGDRVEQGWLSCLVLK